MKKNPYIYINNFLSEIHEPNPFVFCLMLANQFDGKVFFCDGDYLTKVGDRYYGVEGEVLEDELELDEWCRLDKLSILESVDGYHSSKWFYILPYVTQDLYEYYPN